MRPIHRLAVALAGVALAAGSVLAASQSAAGEPPPTAPPATAPPTTVVRLGSAPLEGWSAETALGSAAAQIEAAARIGAEVDRQLVEQRLAEVAEQQAAAQRRLEALEAAQAAAPAPAPPRPAAPQPAPQAGTVWDRLAQCEAGGNWAINTGNGYSGGLQWHPGTWAAYRAPGDPAHAWQATREQQIAAGERLLAASGGRFTAWPGCRAKLGLP